MDKMNWIKKYVVMLFPLFCSMSVFSAENTGIYPLLSNEVQVSYVAPIQIVKKGEGHYFLDFGKDAFGTIILRLKSTQSDPITIQLGEKTSSSNTIDTKPGGTIRYQKVQATNIPVNTPYIVKLDRDKRNTKTPPAIALPDSFGVIMPFRYCELENLRVPIEDVEIRQRVYTYKFNDTSSSFVCSDTVLNSVWDMCKYTVKATSFAGVYIDGDRERTPYEADAYINQLSHYCVDNEYSIARRTNEFFIHNPTWPTEWILHTVLLFYHDFLYTGDLAPIRKNYEALKYKTLIDLDREDGLISSKSPKMNDELMIKLGFTNTRKKLDDIVDWPAAQNTTSSGDPATKGERDGYDMIPINTVVNSFHYINLKLMAEIAGYLGKNEDARLFGDKALLVKNTINNKLFDKKNGIYLDGENSGHSSLHGNMFPLAFGIVPRNYTKSVTSFVKSRGMACSVYGAQYLLEGLYNQNEADYALSLMTSTSDRSWWNMINCGSTMAMEAWDMKFKPNSDWNHAWGTAPANIITRYMWGITPSQPGFAKVRIAPQLGKLTYSKIKVPTLQGAIHAKFKQTNDNDKEFTIELPANMKGEFVIFQNLNRKILVNNKKVKPRNGVIRLSPGINNVIIGDF
jgi:hypothetical protein